MKKAVVGIVEYENKILVGKKKSDRDFLKNAWHIPGGKVDEGESDEEALIREIMEETGIKIKINNLFVEFTNQEGWLVKWYLCSAINSEVKAGDDLADAKFVLKKEIKSVCDKEAITFWPKKVVEYFN